MFSRAISFQFPVNCTNEPVVYYYLLDKNVLQLIILSMILFIIILKIGRHAISKTKVSIRSSDSKWSILCLKGIRMEINKSANKLIRELERQEGTWRVIESMVSTGNSRVCRNTVGGSREKERTYVWDTGGEARSSGEKTPGYYGPRCKIAVYTLRFFM